MSTLTPDVVRFSRKSILVLLGASLLSATGFLWPFFYSSANLPQTQLIFWSAIVFASKRELEISTMTSTTAKTIALQKINCVCGRFALE